MFEHYLLSLVHDSLNLRHAHKVELPDLLKRKATDKPIAKDVPMALIVYPFVNRFFYMTVSILDHRARTQPDPPQVPQVLYWGPLVLRADLFGFVVILPSGLGCRMVTVVVILLANHITYPQQIVSVQDVAIIIRDLLLNRYGLKLRFIP